MEYVIAALAVAAVVAFVVVRLNKPKAKGTSSGGRPRDGVKSEEK